MAAKKKVSPAKVVGSSGLRRTGGYVSADFLPQLTGLNGRRVWGEMATNDPVVSAFLFAVEMLVRQVEWKVDPSDPTNKKAVEMRDEVERVLFKELNTSWSDIISQAATMFVYGFAPLEVTWKKADSGLVVPSRIDLRGQETIHRWEFDDEDSIAGPTHGDITGMWQQDWAHAPVFIPAEKLLHFRTHTALNNPEGRSILRGAYVTWMRKKAVEEAEGRALLRAAGLVVLRVPAQLLSASADENEKAALAQYTTLADNLANDRQGAVILPSDVVGNVADSAAPGSSTPQYDIQYVMADGRRGADMSTVIERMDKRIATTVMADFLLLGQSAVGSFALSDNKTALFNAALSAWLDIMAGVFNRQLLARWWKYNSLDEELRPVLVPGKVQVPNINELGAYITQLAGAGAPLFPDRDLEDALRTRAGLPLPTDETLKERESMEKKELVSQGLETDGEDFWTAEPEATDDSL